MLYLLDKSPGAAVVGVLSSWGFWAAIISTIFIICMGWFFTKKAILKKEWNGVLISLVMTIGLPCLAFDGFMQDVTVEQVIQQMALLVGGFLFYIILGIFVKWFYIKYDQDIREAMSMCTIFALTTFFGIPVVTTLFPGSESNLSAQIFNVPFRVFLYSMGFIVISRPIVPKGAKVAIKNVDPNVTSEQLLQLKLQAHEAKIKNLKINLKNIFLNPVLIATIVGLIFWVTQLIPGINVVPNQTNASTYVLDKATGMYNKIMHGAYSPLRLDNTFPPFFKITKILEGICTPLALLAIGITLGKGDMKSAMRSKVVWYGMGMKIIFAPVFMLIIMVIIALVGQETNAWNINTIMLSVAVIMLATPPASMLVGYTIKYNKQPELTSNIMLLSTLFSIIFLPIWVIVTTAIGATSLFS